MWPIREAQWLKLMQEAGQKVSDLVQWDPVNQDAHAPSVTLCCSQTFPPDTVRLASFGNLCCCSMWGK